MEQISYTRLIILLSVTLLCIGFFCRYAYTGIQRMYYLFSLAGIWVYSGVSTLYIDYCDEYFVPYIVFQCIYTVCMVIGIRLRFEIRASHPLLLYERKNIAQKKKIQRTAATARIPDSILMICTILFFSYYFVQLVYPVFRLGNLFKISLSIGNIFERRAALRSGVIYQLFYYVNMSMATLTFVYLYRKFRAGRWGITVLLFALWYYLQTAVLGYISRNEIMICIVFIIIVFDSRHSKEIEFSARLIILGIGTVALLIPFLNAYDSIRMGVATSQVGVAEAVTGLIKKECYFGKFYDFCSLISDPILVLRYFTWFITLPLPSVVFGSIKSFGLPVNTYFTVLYTGIAEGSKNYSVLLPSILGESLMIYGRYFYWVQAVFLGLFIGKVCTCLEKNKELSLLNLYFAVNTFILGRGGSESVLAGMVNYMLIYLIVMRFMSVQSFSKNRQDGEKK